ncbi:penicillin acylase family protein [Halobacteriovorax sp. HLS]|uniref:penicillin acylase family protein n=1 Tax=Halobacteriovorax sp. HLS TaxID=2234000 RepID=UPI000FD84464|nr:penicillin acylase family protein [Halobacteriovorax sp. HLS]
MNKYIKITTALILIVSSLFIGGIYFLYQRAVPYGSGTLEMPILDQKVSVTRDVEGIPHIVAKSRKDVYRALGYVVASERLFQMELLRRLGSGTLSEVIGQKGLEIDKTFRTIGVRRVFKEKLDRGLINKDMLVEVSAFFEGVNFFVKNGPMPIEFVVANITPREFDVLDSYSIIGYFSYAFAAFIRHDLLMEQLKDKLPKELFQDLQIDPSLNSTMTAKASGDLQTIFNGFRDISSIFYGLEGSNAWAVNSKRSKSGAPILASDPHVTLSSPGIWFEAHLKVDDESDPFETYGHFIPGIPFAAMAHNEKRGWGITISYLDDMDFFKEEIVEQGNQYLFKGKKVDVRRFSEEIKVKGEDDYHLPIRMTEHGPLLDEIIETKSIALKWSFHHILNRPLESFWKMNKAKSFEEFKQATSLAASPGLNIIYADSDDNIARLNLGLYPKRARGTNGMSVLSGAGDEEYVGYMPFEKMPHSINPSSGIVISANNRPLEASSEFTGLWQPRDRFITLYSKLHSKDKWDSEAFMELQNNIKNSENQWMLEILVKNLESSTFTKLEAQAFSELKSWDGLSHATSVGASIYHETLFNITMNSLDELDQEDRLDYCALSARWFYLQRILRDSENKWWDNISTSEVESQKEIIFKSFQQSISKLSDQLGKNIKKWKWGAIHQVEFRHAFGRSWPLDLIFNIGPTPISGAYNEVNNLRMVGCKDGHAVKAGPSTRRIIDFANPGKSYGILPLGNSAHRFSPFYDNQLERYKVGKYRLQIMDDELLKENTLLKLDLVPRYEQ